MDLKTLDAGLSVILGPLPLPRSGALIGRRREDLDTSEVVELDNTALALELDGRSVGGDEGGSRGGRDGDARLADGDLRREKFRLISDKLEEKMELDVYARRYRLEQKCR